MNTPTIELIEIQRLEQLMEEMANAPREEIGKREPGEKCMYELHQEHT